MRKSVAHLKDASTMLFGSRLELSKRTTISSCCWNSHLRALLNAFDTTIAPVKQIPHRRYREPLTRCFRMRSMKTRLLSTVAASAEPMYEQSCKPRTPKTYTDIPPRLDGPLAIFNLADRVLLADLELAIRMQHAEKAWSLFATLVSREDSRYIPIALCSALFSLLTYANSLAGNGKISKHRQGQLNKVLDYVEEEFNLSRDQFIADANILPVPSYKILQRALRMLSKKRAWACYFHMVTGKELKYVSRSTYLKLLSLIQTDDSLTDKERKRRMAFVAKQHAGIPDNDRILSKAEIVLVGKLYHLLENRDKTGFCAIIDEQLYKDASANLVDEIIWRTLQFEDLDAAQYVLDKIKERQGGSRSEVTYANLMNAYRGIHQYDSALEMFERMLASGIQPQIRSFNTALQIFAEQGSAEQAAYILDSMIQLDVQPDVATYSEMIKANANAGQIETCIQYYDMMQHNGIQPNAYTFSILIEAFAKKSDIVNVVRWFQIMLQNDVAPNEVIISCVLKAFSMQQKTHSGVMETVSRIAQHAAHSGIKADATLYTILLRMESQVMGLRGALRVHREMLARFIEPNAYTYTILIDVCGRNDMPGAAQQIFDLMKNSQRYQPNTITYCAMMDAWQKAKRFDLVEQLVKEFLENSKSDKTGTLWVDAKIKGHIEAALCAEQL
ncbi:hypothetical protein DFQ28_001915 [Apophysomyces sp. BC1034]|nr:hypothetical protein DFQ30_002267 [Apophysomyces sp. BC1015]KAG0180018.1 hypothetical protein DFQ29_001322 [Apophysomyces sp. BC1021]KAG0190550.1 hypothetical protein DFQ28_001915 [Apophysomyces sp. BC1034]